MVAKYSLDGDNLLLLTNSEVLKLSRHTGKKVFKKPLLMNNIIESNLLMESTNGDKLVVKSSPKIYVLDGKSGEVTDEIYFPNLNMRYFTYNDATGTVVGFGENGNYSIWRDKTVVESGLSYGGGVPTEFIFLKDGSKILANSHENQTIKIIELKSKVEAGTVNARIMANSNDSSHLLLFDGKDLAVSDDDARTMKKIVVDEPSTYSLSENTNLCQISNDGRYYALIFKQDISDAAPKVLKLYDLSKNEKRMIQINNAASVITFSDDSKKIFVVDSVEGLNVYDVGDLKLIKNYSEIKDNVLNIKMSEDSKIVAVNMLSGTAYLYNLETGKRIEEINGEIINVKNAQDEITVRGIKKNSIFKWSSASGLSSWDMDDECLKTPQSFYDVNLYNENTDKLMIIRNNEVDRKCYLIDFSSGKLKLSLDIALRRYNASGHISPDGKLITMDSDYFEKSGEKISDWSYDMVTSTYKVLSEEEASKEVDEILSGRTLSKEEKVEIGITTK